MAEMRARGAEVAGLDLAPADGVIACDVRDQESVDAAVAEAVERLGGLDVVVNCAGVGNPQSAGARPDADALKVLDVNLLGPWRVTAAALPALRESRGRVVNIASGLAYLSVPLATAYCMSKRGLTSYSDALRLEYGDSIEVTTVYPGYIRTPIHDAAAEQGLALEGVVPAERLEDAAAVVARASLGPYRRDLATTSRPGGFGYFLLRMMPRRLMDAMTRRSMRRAASRGAFEAELAADLRAELLPGAPRGVILPCVESSTQTAGAVRVPPAEAVQPVENETLDRFLTGTLTVAADPAARGRRAGRSGTRRCTGATSRSSRCSTWRPPSGSPSGSTACSPTAPSRPGRGRAPSGRSSARWRSRARSSPGSPTTASTTPARTRRATPTAPTTATATGRARSSRASSTPTSAGSSSTPSAARRSASPPTCSRDPVVSFVNRTFFVWAILSLLIPFGLGYALGRDARRGPRRLPVGRRGARLPAPPRRPTRSTRSATSSARGPTTPGDESRNFAPLSLLTMGESLAQQPPRLPDLGPPRPARVAARPLGGRDHRDGEGRPGVGRRADP